MQSQSAQMIIINRSDNVLPYRQCSTQLRRALEHGQVVGTHSRHLADNCECETGKVDDGKSWCKQKCPT